MRKILIASLSVHWTVVFALAAFSAAPVDAAAILPAVGFATAHGLVAALFLWSALAALCDERCDGIAALAIAVAAPVLAAGIAVSGMQGAAAMQMAALAATWLVIRAETPPEPAVRVVDRSGEVARRLAIGAAHGSMLSRLSRRGPTGEED